MNSDSLVLGFDSQKELIEFLKKEKNWMILRICLGKCCLNCKRLKNKECEVLDFVERLFERSLKEGKTLEKIGCKCPKWE